jgi:hypothetical protein
VAATRRDAGGPLELDVRRMQDHCRTLGVDAAPPGAPGELGVVPRLEHLVALAGELAEALQDDGARRHVDSQRQGLGGEDETNQPTRKQLFHGLLHRRHQPGVMRGDTRLEAVQPPLVPDHRQIGGAEVAGVGLGEVLDLGGLGGAGEAQPSSHDSLHRIVASLAGEDEVDRGQQPLVAQELHGLVAPRRRIAAVVVPRAPQHAGQAVIGAAAVEHGEQA